MKKVIVGAVFAVGLGIAGLGAAAPSMAAPGVTFDCSPCTGAPWTDFFKAVAPWEKITDATDGTPGNGKGAWEAVTSNGPWEKVFPAAP